jgi:hypothetical protein
VKGEIEDWRDLIEQGIRYKENFGNSKRWSTYRDYGRGKFPGFTGATNGILPYNLVYSMKRAMVPNVYFRNPYINVTPTNKPGIDIQARVVEAVDNWLMGELGVKSTFKTMVQDAYYCTRGICKIGYDGLWSERVTPEEERLAADLGIPLSHMSKDKKERVEYNVNVKPGMPWAARIIPDVFIVPFGVRTLDDCPWVDHVVLRSLSDVKADRKYTNTKELEGTHMEMLHKDPTKANFYKELSSYTDIVEIHEIRDFKRKEIKAFVPGYDKWIRPPTEDVLQIDGLPFVDFTFNEDGEYYWGPSDVQIIEPQQLEINEARTQAMYHRRVALLKFLVEEGGMDKEEAAKMLSEMVGPVVWTKGDPNKVVALLQPHIPADLTQWSELIRGDVRELLGQGRQQLGEAPAGRRTAEEMRNVQMASDTRMDERRDIVADALVSMMRKINQIIFERWTTEKVVQVVGVDAARYWVSYKGAENRGEYNLRVDVESMTPKTKMMKKREIVELIQALSKNPRANIDYLMQMLLREYEWVDAMKVLPQAQETMGQPMQQQQFVQQQQGLMNNPKQLQERAGANAEMIGRFF